MYIYIYIYIYICTCSQDERKPANLLQVIASDSDARVDQLDVDMVMGSPRQPFVAFFRVMGASA